MIRSVIDFKPVYLVCIIFLLFGVKAHAQQPVSDAVSKQLILNIKFKTTPENAAKFKDILTELFNTISHEKNFVRADLHQAIGHPEEFLVYEVWNDNIEHFLADRLTKPYVVDFEQKLKDMNVEREPGAYNSFGHWDKK
jgi:quinol monooxygenase YgiN